jgi:hypothetical protein
MEKTECQSIQVVDAGSRTIKQATRIVQEWNGITNSFHLENEEGDNIAGDFVTRQEAETGMIKYNLGLPVFDQPSLYESLQSDDTRLTDELMKRAKEGKIIRLM